MKNKTLLFAALLVSANAGAESGPPPAQAHLDPLVVTASPVSGRHSRAMRSMTVLTREDIEHAPVTHLEDLLAQVSGVTVQRRGAPGAQGDISINGSSFEQVLLLVNGVPVSNPQSGHLDTSLPVPLSAIERIEIVKTAGSVQHGGSGTGGVINIITRTADSTGAGAGAGVGANNTRSGEARAGWAGHGASARLTAGKWRSDAEDESRPNDADIEKVLLAGDARLGAVDLEYGLGAAREALGAWGFYSDVYPDARERTATRMGWLNAAGSFGNWGWRSRLYRLERRDRFTTWIGEDGFANRHHMKTTGGDVNIQRDDDHGAFVAGAGHKHESIDSNNLGRHGRDLDTAWLYRRQRLAHALFLEAGVNYSDYSDQGGFALPSIGLSWQASPRWRTFASWARSARAPGYTELYHDTVANRGNPDLGIERAASSEIGLQGVFARSRLDISAHQRRISDYIGFGRGPGETTFTARNYGRYRIDAATADWRWQPQQRWLEEVRLGHSRLHVVRSSELDGSGLPVPRQTWQAQARLAAGRHARMTVTARRPHYRGQATATLADAALRWKTPRWTVGVQVQNLLNEKIVEAGFAPIAGRWWSINMDVGF